MKAIYSIHDLHFKNPAKTSRNILETKRLYLLKLTNKQGVEGYGEISPFPGLSMDDHPDFARKLDATLQALNDGSRSQELDLVGWPSIRFGMEMAELDLRNGGKRIFFDGPFSHGLKVLDINGLIWMDSAAGMLRQVEEKIAEGFRCIKMKIGALDFDEECRILEAVRKKYSPFQIELRVDANGAFPMDDALTMLKELHRFELHSIEQPIKQGYWENMARLCALSPLAIALDEELSGLDPKAFGLKLIRQIKPGYLILKPGLLGGFDACTTWINLAQRENTPWWITSALESNLGLAAIAQYTANWNNPLPQGLGTGQLYTNNFSSPLRIYGGKLDQGGSDTWNLNTDLPE